ncbi:ATP-binding cassette domain-containing protein [Streptomyces sp. NPDC016172]|uniref:ATP-binding cassette domain-containing protein n=1 Tax=Streptomyces sp. NPDC016172 TaxID=3364964 RepID=UPI0036F6480B
MTTTNLRIRGLTKSFGGVRALDGVDLTVPAGQVHALLGHNGAGKSTLIKCLGGAYPPDAGTIEVGGTSYTRLTPRESIASGVAIIFQTLSVVDALTVAENIFLGQEWTRYGRIDRRAQEEVAAGLLERVAAKCSPRDRVGDLPMGQRQLVEIAKALSRSASVLVLDEPTAALSGAETDALAERVEDLRTQGLAVVYVTHLLGEVERLADAVTVLRDGRVAHHAGVAGQTRRDLVEAVAGSPVQDARDPRPAPGPRAHGLGRPPGSEVQGRGQTSAREVQGPDEMPGSDAQGFGHTSGPQAHGLSHTPGSEVQGRGQTSGREVQGSGQTPGREVQGLDEMPGSDAQGFGHTSGPQAHGLSHTPGSGVQGRGHPPGPEAHGLGQTPGSDVQGLGHTSGTQAHGLSHTPGPEAHGLAHPPAPDAHEPLHTPTRDVPEARRAPVSPRLVVEALHGPGFGPVDLTVASGERVGLFGLIGSGRTRILETLYGRRRATAGTIRAGDRTVTPARPTDALAAGIALVPADRRTQGLFPSLSAQDNTLLPTVRPLARYGVRALHTERRVFEALAAAVGLRPAQPRLPAGAFSGGNQQKLVLGRWINEARHVDVLLLDEPTQGVDVGARREIYRVVSALAEDRGTAVLFASSDPEEIVALADRCLIVARGRIVGELSGTELTEQALLSAVHDPLTAEGAA